MIYCVEDEENIRDLIIYALKSKYEEVRGFESGEELFKALKVELPELLLLDIMLPGEDGIQILDRIRSDKTTADIPVIMLTAKTSELDKIVGLDRGADDYITKPFSVLELLARVKAVLRRAKPKAEDLSVLSIDGVVINEKEHTVTVDEEEIALTFKEFELLLYLFRNKNIVLNREKIMSNIWGYDFEGESRTVDVHIASIRQKLKDKAYLIETVRNVGYKVGYKQ